MDFFSADQHLGHAKVIEYSNRPYKNVEEMNHSIITNINSIVRPNDNLYLQGDFAFAKNAKDLINYLRQIKCQNLHITLGNHDKFYDDPDVQRFFKSIQHYKVIAVDRQKIVLFHFPILEFEAGHRGSWMIHGHTHGHCNYPPQLQNKRIFDVGIDNCNQFPKSFEELREQFKNCEDIAHH